MEPSGCPNFSRLAPMAPKKSELYSSLWHHARQLAGVPEVDDATTAPPATKQAKAATGDAQTFFNLD